MTTSNHALRTLAFIGLVSIPAIATAENYGPFTVAKPEPITELWLNAGFYSYHFEQNKGLNNRNFGIGAEYRYATTGSIVAGTSNNSVRQRSRYAGWHWRPITLGPVYLGLVAGAVDGYPGVNNGGWFPIVIPAASFEYKSVGANLILIPGINENVYGALSLQLKVKLY